MNTVLSDPDVRPAKILYFFVHSVQVSDSVIHHPFAVVNWPMPHPLKHSIGKPYEVWCQHLYETCDDNILYLQTIFYQHC